jgi:hypothetical protein
MSELESLGVGESIVDRVRIARTRPAVLKLQLAMLKARLPNIKVMAFEGDDDKIVYKQWICRINPELSYEPFTCGNKKAVLKLKDVTVRDRSGIGENVYFFVDRDFDDLAGHADHERLFMTDMYSVENYIVSSEVLTSVLTNEFPCHGRPDVRQNIVDRFLEVYSKFIDVSAKINERIFVAQRANVEIRGHIPDGFSKFAVVELDRVTAIGVPEDIIQYLVEVDEETLERLRSEFSTLHGQSRYRGKFAYKFFRQWLIHLEKDWNESTHGMFSGIESNSNVKKSEFVLSNFASSSPLPAGLREFVLGMA